MSADLRQGPRDAVWIVVVYVVLGALAGLVWWVVAVPPYFVRTADDAVMEQAQLGRQVHVDGLFFVIGLVAALVGGLGLAVWRRSAPMQVVLVGTLAAAGAGALALWLGTQLGHQDLAALARVSRPGTHLTDSLQVISRWLIIIWPIGHLAGALSVLLGAGREEARARATADAAEPGAVPGFEIRRG